MKIVNDEEGMMMMMMQVSCDDYDDDTVQTFNYCTRRTDVCQCLVVQIPMDNMPKKAKHIDDPRSL